MVLLALQQFRQLGDLGVFRGVTDGVAEEARTHGFPCLAFARFGFIVAFQN
jgi:hypothetical protein